MVSGKTIKKTRLPTITHLGRSKKPNRPVKLVSNNMTQLKGYRKLVDQFPLRPIQSDADLDRAIAVVDALLDRENLDAGEQDYLDVQSDLIERYEDQTDPPRDVSDAEMLRFLMDQQAVKQVELSAATGIVESTISAILSGKRTLNRSQIGKLASHFHVSPGVFAFGD